MPPENVVWIHRCLQCGGLMKLWEYVDDRQVIRRGGECTGKCKKHWKESSIEAAIYKSGRIAQL